MISVLLVDDQLSIEGLRALMTLHRNGSEITGEASDEAEALHKLESLKPDILLVDIDVPAINGIELVKQAKTVSPGTKAIVSSTKADEHNVLSALKAGARGYILKTESFDKLVEAIRKVYSGHYYLSDEVSDRVTEYYCQSDHDGGRLESLTEREKEVLLLASDGLTNPEIARRLFISHRTVGIHRYRGMKKLHLRNQTEVVRYFLDEARASRVGAGT